ncbi:MAG: hypothetical protein GZ093_14560 [Rhodoferax sp.]|nr:cytochrome b/b6 domain-containing protein [Rhodoferax sp.]NDP39947.1 hypothetical protein [Rhodoferax sp.]
MASGRALRRVGHNPTGSLAIYILPTLATVVGITGVLTLGGDEQQGLAAGWFSFSQIKLVKQSHEALAVLMLLLVFCHLTGVVVESVLHKENLARSMLTGIKLADADTPAARPHAGVALLLLLITGLAGWWFYYAIDRQLDGQPGHVESVTDNEEPRVKFVGRQLPDNAQWRDECGSCHAVFYSALLPARSWQKIMAEQDQHFGTDLGLDAATSTAVLAFMTANSADQHNTEAAFKIEQSIPRNATPLRITETPYWLHKHQEIPAAEWGFDTGEKQEELRGLLQ